MKRFLTRRQALQEAAVGFGAMAVNSMLQQEKLFAAEAALAKERTYDLKPKQPHFPAKAKRVLWLFCSGACSHLDTWDHKPELLKRDGQPLPGADKLVTFQGENGAVARSPYTFRPRGRCGKMTSDLLPLLGAHVDKMAFIHSMTAKSNTHGPAESQMSTGFTLEGFPSVGAWVSYALGTLNNDLPAFVAIPDPRGLPQIGPANWSNGFLPAAFQGTPFSADRPIANLRPPRPAPAAERATRCGKAPRPRHPAG